MRDGRKKLSDVITEQLESMILDGSLLAGQQLPPERELAIQFDVSRPSLREAIGNLQARGLVERKQGGGTFVSRNLNAAITDPLMALISRRPETQFDLLEFRHALEVWLLTTQRYGASLKTIKPFRKRWITYLR